MAFTTFNITGNTVTGNLAEAGARGWNAMDCNAGSGTNLLIDNNNFESIYGTVILDCYGTISNNTMLQSVGGTERGFFGIKGIMNDSIIYNNYIKGTPSDAIDLTSATNSAVVTYNTCVDVGAPFSGVCIDGANFRAGNAASNGCTGTGGTASICLGNVDDGTSNCPVAP